MARRAAGGVPLRGVRAGRDRAARGVPARAPRRAGRGAARDRRACGPRQRPRGARPRASAARADAGPADAGAIPLGPPGRRARDLPPGTRDAGRGARPRAEPDPPQCPRLDPPPRDVCRQPRRDSRVRALRGGRRADPRGKGHDRRRFRFRASRVGARAEVRTRGGRLTGARAHLAGGLRPQRLRPVVRHAARARRERRRADARPPFPRRAARAAPRQERRTTAARHHRLRARARACSRGAGRDLRHGLLPRRRRDARELLPHRAGWRRDRDRAPECVHARARPRRAHRPAPPARPRRPHGRARLGELRGDRGRLHQLRRRRPAAAGRARGAAAADASPPARLHALDLDTAGRARAALGQRAPALSLVVGERGAAAARAGVLAASRRRGRRHGARGVRRGARAGARGGGPMTTVPRSPYKGLAAFDDSELDALLFFGREPEIDAVVANVLANRLTVLYGPSGVGKSSLLRAGVAQRLREQSDAPVVVHDAWAEDPAGGLIAAVREECGDLGATAGLVDTVAAAAGQRREVYLLLDQFEEYVLYHGGDGPLSTALPELLRRPGLRVNVLIAIRDDALAELDEFAARIPELFANLLRLDRLDRADGRSAILGPLERYSELSRTTYVAEPELVEAVLDEASTANGVEAPYLQLVLERLWEQEREEGSHALRLATFRRIGGSRAVVHDHVQTALDGLPLAEQEAAARVRRQLVTPSGRKVSHEAGDLAEYAAVDPARLRGLLEELGRRRIVRALDGAPGAAARWEIFHDVLGPPILAWQHEHQLRAERDHARRQRRRLRILAGAAVGALLVVAAIATYALVQRSEARAQAQRARGRELAGQALADIPIDPRESVQLALEAAKLAPGRATAAALRSSLLAMREERIIRLGGSIVAASFAPRGHRLLVASSDGELGLYYATTGKFHHLERQPPLTAAVWGLGGRVFVTGSATGDVVVWGSPGNELHTGAAITALAYERTTLLVASGSDVRLESETTGKVRTFAFAGRVEAAALDPNARVFAVAFRHGPSTSAELVDARTGRTIRRLPEQGILSFAFSPDGRLLASGSDDVTARLWDASTGRLLHVLRHKGEVVAEEFSRDGKSLVTSSSDGAAYLWNVASGRRELLLVGANGGIAGAAFSPDGNEIATASADRLARIYYTLGGRLLAPLAGHANTVTSVNFDPTGQLVVTGSSDGTARVWDAQPTGALTTIDTRRTPVRSVWLGKDAVSVSGREARILTPSGRLIKTLTMPKTVVAAGAAGRNLAMADAAGDVLIDRPGRHGIALA